ncbi:hypothetical protein [Sulfuricurvum sp.]|uniref:hypothetical protein n=1 Tax=Sulfuricurvum sp. TaxID=2025608 RepID=UPI00262013C9|nr:hypothetical protein [Sulfuricurvum sp.]MDD4883063.1 hypothetical protein [Sulfuricurvum sp.]
MHKELIASLLGVTVKSVYNYEKEERKIISLLNKYMDDNDANEFLSTNKISKFDNINAKGIDQIRKSEIIKLLTKYQVEYLALSLAKSLESNGIISGTSKRLHKTKEKEDFLRDLERILSDLSLEIEEGETTEFQAVIKNFNDEIGFDFNADDKSIVYHIIRRYRVYNTLYDLDV